MNSHFVLLLLCVMVRGGVAFAPERVVDDLLDSTAFNVAMFAMGWAATRSLQWTATRRLQGTIKGNEPPFGLHWLMAVAAMPLALLPPSRHDKRGTPAGAAEQAPSPLVCGDACATAEPALGFPLLPTESWAENGGVATLLAGLSSLLQSRIAAADMSDAALPPWRRSSAFHSKEPLDMNISDYLVHIHWFFECSSPCLVLALIYLDRAVSSSATLVLNAETCPRLFLTCLLAALKFHDDDWTPYSNSFYAGVGHVDVQELNAMEKTFCKSIDWQFYVSPEEYLRYHDLITTAAPATLRSWQQGE